nr:ALPV-306 [Albatrosspox virus]
MKKSIVIHQIQRYKIPYLVLYRTSEFRNLI